MQTRVVLRTIQLSCFNSNAGYVPIGSKIDPTIMGGSRSSGLSVFVASHHLAYQVLVNTPTQIDDIEIPTTMLRKGKDAMPGLHPR
jgi:hypothetical protein